MAYSQETLVSSLLLPFSLCNIAFVDIRFVDGCCGRVDKQKVKINPLLESQKFKSYP